MWIVDDMYGYDMNTGEVEYVDDQPEAPGELHGYFVLSTVGNATISSIDASKALVRELLPHSIMLSECGIQQLSSLPSFHSDQ